MFGRVTAGAGYRIRVFRVRNIADGRKCINTSTRLCMSRAFRYSNELAKYIYIYIVAAQKN